MKRFKRFLKACWRFSSMEVEHPEKCPVWEDDNAIALEGFLRTESGRKLLEIMRYQEHSSNVQAVTAMDNRDYRCGFAAGYRFQMAKFISLSARVTPQEDAIDSHSQLSGLQLAETLNP